MRGRAAPADGSPPSDDAERRWDATSVRLWDGTYGDYLTGKVAKVFPNLFAEVSAVAARSRWRADDRSG